MEPGGTRQTILVAAALAASALLVAWWSAAREHGGAEALSKAAGTDPAKRGVANIARESISLANAKSAPTPSLAVATAAAKTESASMQVGSDATAATSSLPASKADAQARMAGARSSLPVAEDRARSENETQSSTSVTETATADVAKSDAADTASEPTPATDHDNAPENAIDTEKAADLLAHYLADLDSADHADSEAARVQHDFDAREVGGDNERRAEEALRDGIASWIATLPVDESGGLALMSVECRIGQCRILMAQAHYGIGPGTAEDQEHQINLIAAFSALSAEPWWIALGLNVGSSMSFPANDGSGMGLWVQYETMTNAASQTNGA